jgi:Calpain family cysteine protease
MVAGKPRFVAVDDYVPGEDRSPSFSQVTADYDYWAMIIEKSWAKIHGNYMVTEGGIVFICVFFLLDFIFKIANKCLEISHPSSHLH